MNKYLMVKKSFEGKQIYYLLILQKISDKIMMSFKFNLNTNEWFFL